MGLRQVVFVVLLAAPLAADAGAPPLVFHADTPSARGLARQCEQVWRDHGPALVTDLVPRTVRLDTVHCLILDSNQFDRYFMGRLPDWGVGAAVPSGKLVALDYERLPVVGPGPESVFMHEMTHALLFQAAGDADLPTWLHEGAAMRASGEWRFTDTVAVAASGRLPSLHSLERAFPHGGAGAQTAYRTSLLAVTWLEKQHGPGAVPRVLAASRRLGDFRAGFQSATGETPENFAARFAGAMRVRYGWILLLFRWPTLFVIMALVFAVGAIRKIVLFRRGLAEDDVTLD